MYQYVNSFYCATDGEKKEVLIELKQRSPKFTSESKTGVLEEIVANIAMNDTCARELLQVLSNILNKEDKTISSKDENQNQNKGTD